MTGPRLVHPPILVRELVTDSLPHHLISDVGGAFLSSALDSTASSPFGGDGAAPQPSRCGSTNSGPGLHESPWRPLRARIGSDHVTRLVTRNEVITELPKFFDAMISRHRRRQHLFVSNTRPSAMKWRSPMGATSFSAATAFRALPASSARAHSHSQPPPPAVLPNPKQTLARYAIRGRRVSLSAACSARRSAALMGPMRRKKGCAACR